MTKIYIDEGIHQSFWNTEPQVDCLDCSYCINVLISHYKLFILQTWGSDTFSLFLKYMSILHGNYIIIMYLKKKINAILLFLDVPHIAQTHFDSEEPFQNKHNFSNILLLWNILLICIVAIRGKPTIWIRWNYRETFFSCNDELK